MSSIIRKHIPELDMTVELDLDCEKQAIIDAVLYYYNSIFEDEKFKHANYGPYPSPYEYVPVWTKTLISRLKIVLEQEGFSVVKKVLYNAPYGKLVDLGDESYRFKKYSFESLSKLISWVKDKSVEYKLLSHLYCGRARDLASCLDHLAKAIALKIIRKHEEEGFPALFFSRMLFIDVFFYNSDGFSDEIKTYLRRRMKECIRVY